MSQTSRRSIALERFGPPEVMRWIDEPMPERGPDQVLVKIEAIGVNFADAMVRRGEYRRDQPLTFTPGFESAGRVLAGPPGGPAPGSTVMVFTENGGGYADHLVADLDRILPVAEGVSAVQAAGIYTQGTTAWYSVHRFGQLQPGQTVLVTAAAGGLGGLCVQLAVEAGARAIGTASTEQKLKAVRANGAETALIADPETLTAQVREKTDGRGVDVVIDGVGGPLFTPSLRALAFNGRFIVVGSASQQPAMLDARALMPRGQTIVGVLVRRIAEQDPSEPQRAFDEVMERVKDGRLRPQITVLGRDDLQNAHHMIESRRLTGKLVIELDGAPTNHANGRP